MYYIVDHNDMYYICTAAIQYRKQQVGNIGLMHLCLLPYCHTLFTLTARCVFLYFLHTHCLFYTLWWWCCLFLIPLTTQQWCAFSRCYLQLYLSFGKLVLQKIHGKKKIIQTSTAGSKQYQLVTGILEYALMIWCKWHGA